MGVRFLVSEVVVDSTYSGFAKGLMGNFDGNATNEFILPNGTLLDENATKTERDIYFNFGQKCKLLVSINGVILLLSNGVYILFYQTIYC